MTAPSGADRGGSTLQEVTQLQPVSTDSAGADHLAASVLRSLSRSFQNLFSISSLQAFGLGLITLGLWPLWRLRRQFRHYVTFERQQLWHLSEWLRTRRGSASSAALAEVTRGSRHGDAWLLSVAGIVCAVLVVLWLWLSMSEQVSLGALLERTYRFRRLGGGLRTPEIVAAFLAWNVGLSIAYALHWLRVRLQVRELSRFIERFNEVALREGVTPIDLPRANSGVNVAWVVVAVVLASLGAFWGIVMSLAAAGQRAYVNTTARRVRTQLLDRMREMIAQQRPAVSVPSYVIHDRRCTNPKCRAALRAGARFCSRCGTSAGALEEVA